MYREPLCKFQILLLTLNSTCCIMAPVIQKRWKEMLPAAGADLTARNNNGQTLLTNFASNINCICLKYFHDHRKGTNPRVGMFKLRIDAGSVNAKDLKVEWHFTLWLCVLLMAVREKAKPRLPNCCWSGDLKLKRLTYMQKPL